MWMSVKCGVGLKFFHLAPPLIESYLHPWGSRYTIAVSNSKPKGGLTWNCLDVPLAITDLSLYCLAHLLETVITIILSAWHR